MKDNAKLLAELNSLSNNAEISWCGPHYGKNDSKRMCFIVRWSEKGRGFGEYAFYQDKETGKWRIDSETDSKEAVNELYVL